MGHYGIGQCVRENVNWGLTLVAQRSTPRSADQADRHRVAVEPEGADRDPQQYFGTQVPGIVSAYGAIADLPARPRNPRWLWLIPVGAMAVGAMLGILPFLEQFRRPPDNALPLPATVTPQELTVQPSPPPEPSAKATPSPTSGRAPAAPAAKPTTQTWSPSPGPVLLGPSSDNGFQTMVQRYCDRYAGGFADPREDGRWQCRLLLLASIADLDIACRDTYSSAAYAQTSYADDPYAWRCYR